MNKETIIPLAITVAPVLFFAARAVAKRTKNKVDDQAIEVIEEVIEEVKDAKKATPDKRPA